ncbi:MAG: carbamoyltransferase family protein [Flavisolibacter sp.]
MTTLGIYNLGSDPSAAIIQNGQAVAYVEEERLLRYKHAKDIFPIRSIDQVMKQANLAWSDIDSISFPWECAKYDDGRMESHYQQINSKYNINHPRDIGYEKSMLDFFKSDNKRSIILRHLRKHFGYIKFPDIHFVNHHLSHACSAFFTSGFEESLVLTIDGSGEEVTVSVWEGKGQKLGLLKEIRTPISFGWFYSAFTEYIGFNAYGDEWQVMGMASYGKKGREFSNAKKKFEQIIYYDGVGGLEGNPHYIALGDKTFSKFCSDSFVRLMGKPARTATEPVKQWHKDFALAAQIHLEEEIQKLTKYWVKKSGIKNLCIAGGVAMNVKMNGNLFESKWLDAVYVYPVASDAGTSIGAGMAYQYQVNGGLKNKPIKNVYLGNSFSDKEIEQILQKCKLPYIIPKNLEALIAKEIAGGKIIGWFQMGMEAGQRALGARSILADPRTTVSRDTVNAVIKYRQPWRPFCPSMLADSAKKYFKHKKKVMYNLQYPSFGYMTLTLTTNDKAKKEIPAVVHIDGTSRVQIVNSGVNPRYYRLLKEFERLTNIGVILNTSFNIKGEPIVCTPADAIRTFYGTGLDILVLGNCVLKK